MYIPTVITEALLLLSIASCIIYSLLNNWIKTMDITTDYFGSDLSVEDYERLRINHIQHSLALHEPALFDTKWFDYRFLHPTQATYLFAFC